MLCLEMFLGNAIKLYPENAFFFFFEWWAGDLIMKWKNDFLHINLQTIERTDIICELTGFTGK